MKNDILNVECVDNNALRTAITRMTRKRRLHITSDACHGKIVKQIAFMKEALSSDLSVCLTWLNSGMVSILV